VINEMRPFELLKLIRDRVITKKQDLNIISLFMPSSRYLHTDRLLDDFQKLGWIQITENDDIIPTELIFEI